MTKSTQTLEFKFERTIPAAPGEVYDAWLDPKIPGNPWHESDKLIFNATFVSIQFNPVWQLYFYRNRFSYCSRIFISCGCCVLISCTVLYSFFASFKKVNQKYDG